MKGTTEVARRAVIPTPPARPVFWSNVVHEPNCRITADKTMWGILPKGTVKNFGTKF